MDNFNSRAKHVSVRKLQYLQDLALDLAPTDAGYQYEKRAFLSAYN